jgi:hypothetical protein
MPERALVDINLRGSRSSVRGALEVGSRCFALLVGLV